MNNIDLKSIAERLIETFLKAGEESIKIEKEGVKIKTKEDGSHVTNGDLRVNEIIRNHPVEKVGKKLRTSMTKMQQI